jgi:hypothetical protein
MNTRKEKGINEFESNPYSPRSFDFLEKLRKEQHFQNQQFVVPWQLSRKKEEEFSKK